MAFCGCSRRSGTSISMVPEVALFEAGEDAQQRRLPAAGRADDHEELALPDVERDVVDRDQCPEHLDEVADADRRPGFRRHGAQMGGGAGHWFPVHGTAECGQIRPSRQQRRFSLPVFGDGVAMTPVQIDGKTL